MSCKFVADICWVDAGNIAVFDRKHMEQMAGEAFEYPNHPKYVLIDAEPGLYEVTINCDDCWNGEIHNTEQIRIQEDSKLVVSDPCYWWDNDHHDKWIDYLESNEYFQRDNDFCFFNDTGGDGEFRVEITYSRIGD